MATFFSLISRLETSLEQLNVILSGSESQTVDVDGVTKDSISKAIKDSFSTLQSMVSGKVSFETKYLMEQSGAPANDELAEVWNDPTESNNGLYGYSGGVWTKSKYDYILNMLRARYQILGEWKKFEKTGTQTYTLSNDRLYILTDSTPINIAARSDLVVGNNQALIVDTNGEYDSVDGGYVPTVVDLSVGGFTSSTVFVLFSNKYDILGGLLPPIEKPSQLPKKIADNAIKIEDTYKSRWQLVGSPTFIGSKTDSPDVTVVTSNILYLFNGSLGVNPIKIAAMDNVEIPANRPLYIDLDSAKNANGEFEPIVGGVSYLSRTYGDEAFVKGNKILLFVRDTNNSYDGGLFCTVNDQKGKFFGHVVIPDTGCVLTYNLQERTLAWSGDLYFQYARGKRLRLNAGSVTFDSNHLQVAYISLKDINDWNNADPSVCVKYGRYFTGTDRYFCNDDQIPLYFYSSGYHGALCGLPSPKIITELGTDLSKFTKGDMLVKVAPEAAGEVINVYVKGSNPTSNRWIKHRFEKLLKPEINSHTWHTQKSWEVNIDDNGTETLVCNIITSGENETAIKEAGKADFIGGTAHGDEESIWSYALVDGVEIDTSIAGDYSCGKFELVQKSRLWEEGTEKTSEFGLNWKHWTLTGNDMRCYQRTVASRTAQIESWYHTLWCIARSHNGVSVSNFGARAPLWEREEIELEGHAIVHSDTRKIMAWGDAGIKFDAEVEHATINGNEIEFDFFFQNTVGYNKAYFNAAPSIPYFNQGDVVETTHRYTITTNN